jgi:Flp pilus assembly protein TadG
MIERRGLRRFFARRKGERAQALVEFAILLPIMLLIITGLIDLARAVWEENTLAYAAREGTRYLIVHGANGNPPADPTDPSDPTTATAKQIVRSAAIGVSNVTVTISWPGSTGCPVVTGRTCPVVVDATSQFVPLPSQYMLGGAFKITLRGGSRLVIQR